MKVFIAVDINGGGWDFPHGVFSTKQKAINHAMKRYNLVEVNAEKLVEEFELDVDRGI